MSGRSSVSLGIWIGVGSRHEPQKWNGASHFIEHMLFKGTQSRSAKQISEAIEGVGGTLNAFTEEERTCFYARAHTNELPLLMEVLSDMVQHSILAPEDIRKERAVIREEILQYQDQPSSVVLDVLNEIQWPEHPLGRPILGTRESLSKLRARQLKDFMVAHYVPNNIVIAASGNIDHGELVALAKKYWSRLPTSSQPPKSTSPPPQHTPASRHDIHPSEQAHLALGIRTCSRHDTQRSELRLINAILAENMSSRLFQILREDLGLAYHIDGSNTFFRDAGMMTITAGVDVSKLSVATKACLKELNDLKSKLVSKTELQQSIDYVVGQSELHLESVENYMMWIGEQWLGYSQLFKESTVYDRFSKISPRDIRCAARRFFQPNNMNLSTLSASPRHAPPGKVLGT